MLHESVGLCAGNNTPLVKHGSTVKAAKQKHDKNNVFQDTSNRTIVVHDARGTFTSVLPMADT